ncbi:ATP-dependent DNA helicase [Trichonephila clavata]|uniref:ATP-dependent DNA helicase n=1 Tax=Trichonephila clavata TaxID=2740835 RepID=A0A8X6KWJ7_TRICU|nr:ATP-dependent DNA helicase [Trichonephila clavata]
MLRSNINIKQGLVNGAMGIITGIVWPLFHRDQIYNTDNPSVRIDFGKDGIHLIKPKSIQFSALRNYGTIELTQLPLILCWAFTVHKMRGCTVDHTSDLHYLLKDRHMSRQRADEEKRMRQLRPQAL